MDLREQSEPSELARTMLAILAGVEQVEQDSGRV